MLLAELDGNGYAVVVGAIFVGATSLVTSVAQLILGYLRERNRIIREQEVADRLAAEQAKTTLAVRKSRKALHTLTADQNKQIANLGESVETVRKSTNGLTERLVQESKEGAYAKGLLEGQAKAKVEATSDSAIRLMVEAASKPPVEPKTEPDISVHDDNGEG